MPKIYYREKVGKKGNILTHVKYEEEISKLEQIRYQLSYNCISFIEQIDGISLKNYMECVLVIMFYIFDSVMFLSVQ